MPRPLIVLLVVCAASAGCGRPAGPASPAVIAPPVAPVPAGPQVDSPDYANWKRFPVGTSVKRKSVTTDGKNQTTSVETLTLIEATDAEVVVERQNTTERVADGKPVDTVVNPTEQRRYKKSFALPAGMTAEDFAKPAMKAKAAGEEKLTVLGKEYKVTVFKWQDGTDAGPMKITAWLSDEIPGRIVKQVMEVKEIETTTTDQVVELKRPEKN